MSDLPSADAAAAAASPDTGLSPMVPVRRPGKGLTYELVEALGERLRNGSIRAGDKLPPEAEIMQAFGVSRGVVREALSRLQAAGLVQTHHGVGTFALDASAASRPLFRAAPDSSADLLELLELRSSFESDAAGLAALRRTAPQLARMRQALDDFERHLAQQVGETVAPDYRFHLAIAQATGNRYFGDLIEHLGMAVIPRTRVSSSWLDDAQRERHLLKVHQEHQDIYAAIDRGDADAARAAMRIHLLNSRERQRVAHAGRVMTR